MSALAIAAGDIVMVENEQSGAIAPWMVFGPCEHRSTGYFCNSHNAHLANVYNLTLHLEADEQHAIVAWCGTCRLYRAVDSAQIRALDPHADPTLPLGD